MKNNNTTINATVNSNIAPEEFYTKLGELVAQYLGFVTIINPMETKGDETADSGSATKADEPAKKRGIKRQATKETARKTSYTSANTYDGTETDAEILIRIIAKHPEIRLRDESETYVCSKTGVLTCESAAMWMIHKSADNGKLFDETLEVAIAAHLHETWNGLCAPTLLMLWRILALHNYNHAKVKELLIELLRKNTVNAITVLAKATEKYTQRNVHDQRVMYIESLLAEHPGIKNQFSA